MRIIASNNEVSYFLVFCESLATLNGITYTSDDIISDEGFYTFIINNEYGKSYTVNFEIDKTPPTFTLEGVSQWWQNKIFGSIKMV